VVRTDQGGDTASEGQAYAMLLAVAANDRKAFTLAWRWARVNLQRPDGLLSWHWSGGALVDPAPASDADLDAANALLLAARRFRQPVYRRAALRMGKAILDVETVQRGGKLLLVPGPWATGSGVLNPSYFDLHGMATLGRASKDRRWDQLISGSRRVAGWLTTHDPPLPPDWAQAESGPTGPPDQPGNPPQYGFDAVRLPIRFAVSCDRRARSVAARMWPWLRDAQTRNGSLAAAFGMDGQPAASYSHPAALVGAAGAAAAAGDRAAVDRLLTEAEQLNGQSPSYYGAAWLALGRVLLQTRLLGGCGSH
jgi:endoglucanase